MTDTVTIELPRKDVESLIGHAGKIRTNLRYRVINACRKALANPQPETPGLREAAEKLDRVLARSGMLGNNLAGAWRDLQAALSQTPGGAQKEIRGERTCPDCKGTGVRNANHGMCRSCNGYGKFQDPPPTATEESEPVSESVDSSRGGDELIFEAEAGVKIVQRFDGEPNEYELVMPSGNRNIWFTDREAAIYCAQVVGSCWLEAEACGAMEEREAAANPSPSQSGGERLREAAESFKNAADAYVETKLQPEFADEYYRERVGLAAALEGELDGGGPFAGINILTDERVPDGCVGILHDGELEVFRLSDGEKVGPEGPGGEGE